MPLEKNMVRWTEADIQSVRSKLSKANHPERQGRVKESKFKNKPTYVDNLRFASQKEANYYLQLKLAKAMNQIRGFARQVSIPLPSGKRRMIIDFLVIHLDGTQHWIDTKGFATPEWRTKQVELEHSLGIKIETV